jgi:hypothetical protein
MLDCRIRYAFPVDKMDYDHESGMVIYRSKLYATRKRNYPLMRALKRLRLLMNHISDNYEHLVRYTVHANCSRGVGKQTQQAD